VFLDEVVAAARVGGGVEEVHSLTDAWLGKPEPPGPFENRSHTKYKLIIDAPAIYAADSYENNDTKAIVDGRTAGAANSPNFGLITGAKSARFIQLVGRLDF